MTIEAQVAAKLAAAGLGAVGEKVFLWTTPDVAGTTVTVTPTGGPPPDARRAYDEPTFQVRVRGTDGAAVSAAAAAIFALLHSFEGAPFTAGGEFVVFCESLQSGPTFAGRDASGRDNLVLNFRARVESPATNNRD